MYLTATNIRMLLSVIAGVMMLVALVTIGAPALRKADIARDRVVAASEVQQAEAAKLWEGL